MRLLRSRLAPMALLTFFSVGHLIQGAPFFVDHHCFATLTPEGPCRTPGGFTSGTTDPIPGWTGSRLDFGQFQPGTPKAYFNTLPDGPTSAYINDSGNLTQRVGAVVHLGLNETLAGMRLFAAGLVVVLVLRRFGVIG
jgi:hypothetical protein